MSRLAKLEGTVQRFKGNGRKLGYPTANLSTDTDLTDGVYFGFANLAKYKNHPALIFVGTPLTLSDKVRRVEAHLLDIDDIDYYGLKMQLEVKHFWRFNQKFRSRKALVNAMKADEVTAREWFKESDRI